MQKIRFSLFSALALMGIFTGGVLNSAPARAQTGTPPAQPAFYVLKDQDSTLYIFGSAHHVLRGTPWRTGLFNRALAESDVIWFESTQKEMSNPLLRFREMTSGYDKDNPLSKRLTDEEMERLEQVADEVGFSTGELNHMRPWLAAMILSGARGADAVRKGMEKKQIFHRGVEDTVESLMLGTPIRSIEDTTEHMLLFSSLAADDEKAFLMNTVDDLDTGVTDDVKALTKAWSTGDLAAVDTLMNKKMRDKTPGLYNAMMLRRNHIMADAIIREMKGSGTDFFIFGAGHLAGDGSVLALLENQGYKATRIYDETPPVTTNTERIVSPGQYQVSQEIPDYLNVSLRSGPGNPGETIMLRLSYPVTFHGCVETSPIQHKIQQLEGSLDIYTAGYLRSVDLGKPLSECGSSGIRVDIPLDAARLKKDGITALNLVGFGRIDSYRILFDGDTLRLVAPAAPAYYRPDPQGKLSAAFTQPL